MKPTIRKISRHKVRLNPSLLSLPSTPSPALPPRDTCTTTRCCFQSTSIMAATPLRRSFFCRPLPLRFFIPTTRPRVWVASFSLQKKQQHKPIQSLCSTAFPAPPPTPRGYAPPPRLRATAPLVSVILAVLSPCRGRVPCVRLIGVESLSHYSFPFEKTQG